MININVIQRKNNANLKACQFLILRIGDGRRF